VLRRLEDQLPGTTGQPLRRVQTGHVVHQVPPRRAVPLDLAEHVPIQPAEELAHVQRLAHQLPHACTQRLQVVVALGTGGHQQENRRARADRRIGAKHAAHIEGLSFSERGVEHDDIGARGARPLEH